MADFAGRAAEINRALFGTPMTLKAARAFRDHFLGSPYQLRQLDNWLRAYEGREINRHSQRVQQAADEVRARHDAIVREADELMKMGNEVMAEVKSGALTPTDGRKQLAKIAKVYKQIAARAEQCSRDEDATEALANEDPAEWQERMVSKYPTLAKSLPLLSSADLD